MLSWSRSEQKFQTPEDFFFINLFLNLIIFLGVKKKKQKTNTPPKKPTNQQKTKTKPQKSQPPQKHPAINLWWFS